MYDTWLKVILPHCIDGHSVGHTAHNLSMTAFLREACFVVLVCQLDGGVGRALRAFWHVANSQPKVARQCTGTSAT